MGSGIWSMHFVGMLAFSLPITLGYGLAKTLLSWLAAVAVSGLALQIASQPRPRLRTLAGGALLMGAGICAMHYTGMAALDMAPGIVWNPWLVLASAAIACAASAVALHLFTELPRLLRGHPRCAQTAAALVMGAAITGMHYTGMAAAGFPAGSVCGSADGLAGINLGALVVLATLVLLAVTRLVAAQDVRLQAQAHRAAQERLARQSADTANQAKTQFLARMSHELRTPLNAIHGFAELMLLDKGPPDPAAQRLRLELIIKSSRHLATLIDDLLDVSRIELGALDVQVVSTEVGRIVQAAAQELADRARLGGISLHGPAVGQALWAMADPVRMHQIASNLISNAIKYNRRGGSVQIAVALQDEWVRLRVADTGEGLSASQLQALFQPFNRLGQSAHTEGVGIGLVITQHLVDNMGGRIEVQSTPGQGSIFTVLLRRGRPEAAPADSSIHPQLPASRSDVRGSVLYIEDDEVNRILTQSYLQLRPGVQLRLAGSGEAGVASALAQRPDLVLVDMSLPDTHGLQLAARLQAVLGPGCPPLVAYSANAMAEDIATALASGFSAYLVKPASTQAILETVDRHLQVGGSLLEAPVHDLG
jgi:signal transduction histidine kinase/ActR/RegA family two-component response regulator